MELQVRIYVFGTMTYLIYTSTFRKRQALESNFFFDGKSDFFFTRTANEIKWSELTAHLPSFTISMYTNQIPSHFASSRDGSRKDPYNGMTSSQIEPTSAAQAWTACVEALRKRDEHMIQGWKEDIDTLLVFVSRSFLCCTSPRLIAVCERRVCFLQL